MPVPRPFPERRPRRRGFTLVELVVVIVVLGLLAAVALPRFVSLRDPAERAAIESWVGALRTAQKLAYAKQLVSAGPYTASHQMPLFNLVRCDGVDLLPDRTGPGAWQGHYAALGQIRSSVFADPNQPACLGDRIEFSARSGRTIRIDNGPNGITWTATPDY